MDEAEWLACEDVKPVLEEAARPSPRKLILFSAACIRRGGRYGLPPAVEEVITSLEDLADDQTASGGTQPALSTRDRSPAGVSQSLWEACEVAALGRHNRGDWYSTLRPLLIARHALGAVSAVYGQERAEQAVQVAFVRCIFGNPFRPVEVEPEWLTSTVVALAGGIDKDRAFDRLPILADALQDAGCTDEDVLAHCRGDGPHVRGCWVVDAVLGKT